MWTKWHLGKPAKLLPHLRLTMQGTKSQAYWRKCRDKSASMAPRMKHPERGPLTVTAAGAWNLDDFCKMWISCLVSWREVPFTSFPEALFFSSLLASDSKKTTQFFDQLILLMKRMLRKYDSEWIDCIFEPRLPVYSLFESEVDQTGDSVNQRPPKTYKREFCAGAFKEGIQVFMSSTPFN